MKEPVTIIIPTFNNREYLQSCLISLSKHFVTKGLYRVIIVNNGHPKSCDWIKSDGTYQVINTGQNLGWEGGLKEGLKHTDSEFVIFLNDDTYIPVFARLWVNKLLQHFRDPEIGAVGPSSNVVMGLQNIFADVQSQIFASTFLIGFCMMVRRSALEKAGGIDDTLPGGDDIDLSIRLRNAGYKLIVDRDTFVFHHGFKTGNRVKGDSSQSGGWNSLQMTEATNLALIKKHGFKQWYETLYGMHNAQPTTFASSWEDIEGNLIREYIVGDKVLDLGCGNNKTIPSAIGLDMVRKDETIETLVGNPTSQADIAHDVSEPLPFDMNSCDTVIARHILEHLIDPIKTLKQWIEVLKPGGRLIIAVPDQDIMSSIPVNIEHVHAFTQTSIKTFLEAVGLKVLEVKGSNNKISLIAVAEKV